jgi:thiol-disulfide isomerase/thioredoxin
MMKNTLMLAVALAAVTSLQSQGIQFAAGSWEEILKEAGRQNKIVFVDAYTTWCGPCKMMDRNTFSRKDVGDFFNANFINAKIDMEKGEGPSIAEQYSVRAYPTFLFVDAEGTLVYRTLGYQEGGMFIENAQKALDPANSLFGMEKRYKSGDRDPDFLRRYTEVLSANMNGSHNEVVEAYLKTQTDLGTEENMEFVLRYAEDPNSPAFEHIFKNRKAYEEMFGEGMVMQKIQRAAIETLGDAVNEMTPEAIVNKLEDFFQDKCPDVADKLSAEMAMSIYRMTGNGDLYGKAAVELYEKYPTDDYMELNEAAWGIYDIFL